MTFGKNFRLPLDVRPVSYVGQVKIDLAADRFEGQLAIELTLSAARAEVYLHGVGLEIEAARADLAGRAVAAKTSADAESETVTLSFGEALPAGKATLHLTYKGAFSPGLRGLYRAGRIAVTQFEAADARRLFPCFDEPAFKATWELSVSGVPAGAVALSNGVAIKDEPDGAGARRITFAPTPVLSSYLVAAVVGELAASDAITARDVPIRTWSVPEKKHLTAFAQRTAAAVLPLLEDYFGLPYPFGKLDQVGVPDFEAGAMENAGCVTFREVALLLDEATAPLSVQKRVAEVITHELAHQWFGNLVTMVWWDDLWLNEAFATWMAYKVVDAWRPEWRIWMDFEGGKGAAMLLDSLHAAHPIRSDVNNATEAGESFDAITYEKGGAVLRMIEGYLNTSGEDKFRDGIRLYMRRHREANATADDLWGALADASGQPIVQLANGWIRQVGYPVVSMSLDEKAGAVSLKQRRFFADPDAREAGEPTRWLVPIVLRYRDDGGVKEQAVLLNGAEQTVKLAAKGTVRWCFGNADARGFFRSAYDGPMHARLLGAVGELRASERLALLSDQWALVRAGMVTIGSFLDLLASLRAEEDHVVLDDIVGRLATLDHRHVAEAERPRFQAFINELFGARAAQLGWDTAPGDTDETRLRRAALLRAVVLLAREPGAVAEAQRRLPGDPSQASVDPNLLDVVVTAAARGADLAGLEELRRRAREEKDPAAKRRYLHALARVEAPPVAARAVELALEADVPMQDFTSYLGVLMANPATREAAWTVVKTRFPEVRAKADSPMLQRRLVEGLSALPERRHLEEIKAFLAAHPIDGAKQATAQTLERLTMDVALRERLMPAITAWLQARK
jgi:puromycin-sensitive aminopeptidase